jgi:hypothetical protein
MNRSIFALAVAVLCAPTLARASEKVVQFRSAEDPASPPDAAFCDAAPFAANVRLGASLYTYQVRRHDGRLDLDEGRKIGTATACALLTNFLFPIGLQQDFIVRFDLPQGSFTAVGTCTISTNDVPLRGLVLAGCALHMTAFPAGVVGGAVASVSTFNPLRLPGFSTGSYWTLQYYDTATADGHRGDSERAMEWIDHDRSGRDRQ